MAIDTLLAEADDLQGEAVSFRRTLHEHPELGLELPFTQERVLEAIDGLDLDVRVGDTTTSVVATLDGARPGPTILLRGDMDALPMPEDTGLDFSSRVEGTMHACGHDLHTTMLVGAARLLAARRAELAGSVRFMFQPGEEGHHGARYMLEEGLLDAAPDRPVTGAFALHVFSVLPAGVVALRGGSQMASADQFLITVNGHGGHASAPFQALDPVPIACEIVTALQTFVTRGLDVFDPGVITVGRIMAGTTFNVIPETAELYGTMRAVSERTRMKLRDGMRRVAEGIAAAHGTTANVELDPGYPVTVNDREFAGFVHDVAVDLIGREAVLKMPHPVMGSEDFSYVLQRVPGAMAFLGAAPPGVEAGRAEPNHSNRVMFDEQVMARGTALYAAVALRHLAGAETG
jgi:hippurate hydrolase